MPMPLPSVSPIPLPTILPPSDDITDPSVVTIALGERSYQIVIGADLFGASSTYKQLPPASRALIVTNTTVAPLYSRRLRDALGAHYGEVMEATRWRGAQELANS